MRSLTPEQASKFRENRLKAAKAAKPAEKKPDEGKQPEGEKPAADKKPDEGQQPEGEKPKAEVVQFGEEEKPAEESKPEGEEELSPEELAKLDEKARKAYDRANREAAKVRKRAQDAEARLADLEKKLSEQTQESARAVTLAGNVFAKFTDDKIVTAYAGNAQEALALLKKHERDVNSGRADKADKIEHVLPDGKVVEIGLDDLGKYKKWQDDAGEWLDAQETLQADATEAEAIATKHSKLEGYTAARDAYNSGGVKLRTLVAKAAMYDLLQSRKATITFPEKAGAATKAPDPAASPSKEAATPTKKPTESPAAQPRLERGDDEVAAAKARKSALLERAKTATGAEKQRLINEAIKIRIPASKAA